ncbi:hypothetical protein HKI87_08g51790 [Chloropicon roscoffensis]|uniref:Uncharacterized protein n=1 Tax=Chloropicon roscoffensis TaxID=1461544 RepID=A0AAX4PCD7_9CHLO
MLSENKRTPSSNRVELVKKVGDQVARDLSNEFKENTQSQKPQKKRVTFRLDGDDVRAGSRLSAGGMSASFESPRRRDRDEARDKAAAAAYSPASKLTLRPVPSSTFQQLSRVVNGVKDLERRIESIEAAGRGPGAGSPGRRMETEVARIQRKLSDISDRLKGPARAQAREGVAWGTARAVGRSALHLLLLLAAVLLAAAIAAGSRESLLTAYEQPT